MNTGRLVGVILIVVGFGIAVIAGLWLALQVQQIGAGGALIGAVIAFIPVALLVGGGIYMYVIGSKEVVEESSMQQQRQLLDIVKSRGQVAVADLALEMKTSVDNVKNLLNQLVGLQVFSGYVNWEKGVIYSSDAKQLRELDKCKNCGGEIKLVGKGVVTCRFCGMEYFLS
ncbi:MAG: hypothetical protein K8L97_26125 [Anaerolineae bacterium]|nr:hypothetical protein [Anaerolineae bacterium]